LRNAAYTQWWWCMYMYMLVSVVCESVIMRSAQPNVVVMDHMSGAHAAEMIDDALRDGRPGHVILRQANSTTVTEDGTLTFIDAIVNSTGWVDKAASYALGNVPGRTKATNTTRTGTCRMSSVGTSAAHVYVTAHSEASYLSTAPRAILFSCPRVAVGGGATPLHDTELVASTLKLLAPSLFDRVLKHGVIYIRNFPEEGSPKAQIFQDFGVEVYRSWQQFLPNMSRTDAEAHMRRSENRKVEWEVDGTMHIQWHRPGFAKHPSTGRATWFNQLYAMNGRYWQAHGGFDEMQFEKRPMHTLLGNGEELTDREYWILEGAHAAARVSFRWSQGDVAVLDNYRFMHSREPYIGKRHCVVSMGPAVNVKPAYQL